MQIRMTVDAPMSVVPGRGWQVQSDRCAFGLLLFAVFWAPWPLGSNREWATAALAIVAWAGVLIAGFAAAMAKRTDRSHRLSVGALLPLAAWAAFAFLLLLQLIPGLGDAGGPISIDRFHTRQYLLTTLIYIGAWLLVLLTVNAPRRATRLLGAVVLTGVLQAFIAVLLYSSGAHYDLLFTPFSQGDRATGTFPNPDHLAGYMELCLSAGFGWLLSQFGRGRKHAGIGWQHRLVGFLAFVMSRKMLLRLLLVNMVIALVMTHSRMGNGAFFIALTITGTLIAVRSHQLRRPALWLVVSVALVDVLIIGQWVGLEHVVERMRNTAEFNASDITGFGAEQTKADREETIEQRLVVPRLALRLATDRPWLGHGGGSFATAFPPFKTAASQGLYWDHAHDDYVQVACDMGFVGLALWLFPGAITLFRAISLLADSSHRESRAFAVGATMAIVSLGVHSLVDFNLHIPANALTLTVLLAAVWTAPNTRKQQRRQLAPQMQTVSPTSRKAARLSIWPTLLVSAWVVWEGQAEIRADWASAATRNDVVQWVSGSSAPASTEAWQKAHDALAASLNSTPGDPGLQERMGDLYVVAGQRDWDDLQLRHAYFTRAAECYQRAIELRPSEPGTWAMLSASLQAAGQDVELVHAAWLRGHQLGPFEAAVQPILMQIVVSDWAHASNTMRTWAQGVFDHGTPSARRDINALAKSYDRHFDVSVR